MKGPRTRLAVLLTAAGILLALAACAEPTPNASAPEPSEPPEPPEGAVSPPPDGWRWESFRGIEVAVPADWGHAHSTGQLTSQWCINEEIGDPVVARPGPQTLVACEPVDGTSEVDPGTLVEKAGVFVGFEDSRDTGDGTEEEGDRTTVTRGGVSVLVQADRELRERIVATIRSVDDVDHSGCPVSDPVATDPGRRPEPAADVASLTGIEAVAACRYAVGERERPGLPSLISSLRLEGDAAREAVAAVAEAPEGGGPDAPETCAEDYAYGDEMIVLRVTSAEGEHQVYLRYSGCDHNGLDDGTTVRTLTPEAVHPFVAGPNLVGSYSGPPSKRGILNPAD